MSTATDTRAYIGRCPDCGGIVSALSHAAATPKRVGDFHREVLEAECDFERATDEEIKTTFGHSKCCRRYPRRRLQTEMF